MSGKRDSDPRPQPWQGCALPTELFPRFLRRLGIFGGTRHKVNFLLSLARKFRFVLGISLNASAKVMLFLKLTKFSGVFFSKKCDFIEFFDKNGPNPCDFGSLRTQKCAKPLIYHRCEACL